MVTFSSNSQQAQQSTSRITSATTPLNQASSLQNDTRTTLIGNQDIQSSITSAKNSANQIASAISGAA
ncbi:TIGR04197 family type VII secretion effector, partial [Enterococcus mundtii]